MNPLFSVQRQAMAVRAVFRNQWLEPDAMQRWQTRRLQAMIAHAYAAVPFHRQRMQALGLHPQAIRSLGDLKRLPLSDKAMVQANYPDSIIAQGFNRTNAIEEYTSGSTGIRLQILHDQQAYDYYAALTYRQYHEMGYRPWHRRAYFRWKPYATPLLPERIGLLRRYFVPIDADPASQYAALLKIRPQLICAYPSSLLLLCQSLSRTELLRIRPQMIEVNSEKITPAEKARIEECFGCKVFDEYSSFEMYQMAFQCRYQRYHVVEENVLMEIVDSEGHAVPAGEVGEIVVTGLTNRAMPLIRYRTGDLAAWSDERCPCGRSHKLLHGIEGRKNDIVTVPSGRRVSPLLIFGNMLDQTSVLEYQFVQKRRDHFVIRIVTNDPHPADLARRLVAIQQHVLPDEAIHWEVEFVERIERGATGKLRCIVVQSEATSPQ